MTTQPIHSPCHRDIPCSFKPFPPEDMLVCHPCPTLRKGPLFCCECNSRQEWASCHRGKRCLSPGMSAVDHQRISPWGCPNNPGGSDGTNSPLFQPPGESENVEEMTIPIARSPQRRGWEAQPVGSLCPALLSPLATCLGVSSLRRGNGHPLAGLLSFLLPNPVT